MQMSRRAAILLFSIVILAWGMNWTVVKLIVLEVPPLWSAVLRTGIAAVTVFVVQCATGQFVIPKRHDVYIVLVIGVINMAVAPALMAAGLQFMPAGRSIVLGYTTPLWVAPGAWFFLHEKLPRRRLVGIIIGMCGVVVLCNPLALYQGNSDVLIGTALLLLNAFSWAVGILCIRAYVWLSTPFQLLFWQTLLGTLLLLLPALAVEGVPSFTLTPSLALLLAYSGIPATALAVWAMTVINSCLPAATTSLSVLATPVVGIFSAVIFLGESVDMPLVVATGLILGGIALGTIPARK
ncbi:MAG: DMT family transporter [Desulfovibrio sp.]|jgi:drug/metabolite transporter (DMT)-like permease|nr:DMT family transporter [Desulfovibrio sp.]